MTTVLQVQSPAGDWQPITLKQNQVAVFAGETLQHATAGRIKAAMHRVVLDPAAYQTVVRRLIRPWPQAFPRATCYHAFCRDSAAVLHGVRHCEMQTAC